MIYCTQLGANHNVPNLVHNRYSKLGFLKTETLIKGIIDIVTQLGT